MSNSLDATFQACKSITPSLLQTVFVEAHVVISSVEVNSPLPDSVTEIPAHEVSTTATGAGRLRFAPRHSLRVLPWRILFAPATLVGSVHLDAEVSGLGTGGHIPADAVLTLTDTMRFAGPSPSNLRLQGLSNFPIDERTSVDPAAPTIQWTSHAVRTESGRHVETTTSFKISLDAPVIALRPDPRNFG